MSIEHLFSASLGLAIFIITLIVGKKKKQVHDYILVVWLMIFAVNFISLFLLNRPQDDFDFWEIFTFEFTEASVFLHGPMLYLYTRSLIEVDFQLLPRDGIHFVPFTLAFSILLIGLISTGNLDNQIRNYLLVGKMLSVLFYGLWVIRLLYTHKRGVEHVFSNTESKYLTWLEVLSWGILVVWTISIMSLLIHRFSDFAIPQYGGLLTNIAVSLFLFVIGHFGIRQPSLFLDSMAQPIVSSSKYPIQRSAKYEKSGLSQELAQSVHQTLRNHMAMEKPFLDPDLTLYSLAHSLHIPPNHLSQVINSLEKKNFYDFINHYRIEAFKQMIIQKEYEHLTMVGLAYECGFNSKTSFNRVFKKNVGMTPSQFKKQTEQD